MPITTTSGYTYPIPNTPTTQSPNTGSPYSGTIVHGDTKLDYSNWNGDILGYLQYMAENGDQDALDRLYNYFLTEKSNQTARDWTASREDSAYQRLVADMKKAGLNPYAFATMGGSPIASSSHGSAYGGSYSSTYDINKSKLELEQEKIDQNWLKIALSAAIPIFGAMIAAML